MKLYITVLNSWLFCHTLAAHLTDQDFDSSTGNSLLYRRGEGPGKTSAKPKTVTQKANSAVQAVGRLVKADTIADKVGEYAGSSRVTQAISQKIGKPVGRPVEFMAQQVSDYVKGTPAAQPPQRLMAEIRGLPARGDRAYMRSGKVKNETRTWKLPTTMQQTAGIQSRQKVSAGATQVGDGSIEARVRGANTRAKLTIPQGGRGHVWTEEPDGRKSRTSVEYTGTPFRWEPPRLPNGEQRQIGAVVQGDGGKVSAKAWNR